ncbi:MAG TPA: SprT family zinc-dependent metalloprotease [Paludibacteraceae bacterium]|nr:SprT family zinc-dependent metalloprotease [Paludibacteraceae bacterium]
MKTIIQHPEIGNIEVCTRRGTRGVSFRVTADKVRITVNPLLSKSIFPLSAERIEWILKAQEKLKTRTNKLIFTPDTVLKTYKFTVYFVANDTIKTTFAAQRKNDTLTIYFKPNTDFTTAQSQLVITRILTHFLHIEATAFLPNRLKLLADIHGFTYSGVKINSARRRWGSCSAKKQINLSLYLMLLTEELIDFVIVHELCHTREMNHGERFKKLMRNIFPNYDELNKSLKKQAIL